MRFLENPAAIYKEARIEAPKENKYDIFYYCFLKEKKLTTDLLIMYFI